MTEEFDDLEEALGSRHGSGDETRARTRILAAVRRELELKRHKQPGDFWRFAAGIAAALLFGINLAMSAGANTGWGVTKPHQSSTRSLQHELRHILTSDL